MAKMRATLRKIAQVTPPPSPKNGEDVKTHPKEWSSRLRNHSKTCDSKSSPEACIRKALPNRKESPGQNHEDHVESKSATVNRHRNVSGDALNYWGPRRSARLIGIPAEVESCCEENAISEKVEIKSSDGDSKTSGGKRKAISNGNECCCYEMPLASGRLRSPDGIDSHELDTNNSEGSPGKTAESRLELSPEPPSCLPLKKRRVPPLEQFEPSSGPLVEPKIEPRENEESSNQSKVPDAPCTQNGQHSSPDAADTKRNRRVPEARKSRTIRALLMESERFLQYPSKSTSRSRSTYNSRDTQPPSSSPTPQAPPPPEPECHSYYNKSAFERVNQVEFSFEIVPTRAVWYQTFLRDENQPAEPTAPTSTPAPFLLPYEMSLDTILKSNRAVRQKKRQASKKVKQQAVPQFRPIISTRLQMQTAARQSQNQSEKAKTKPTATQATERTEKRPTAFRKGRTPWLDVPRKSPRCHASTLAILCSKQSTPTPPAGESDHEPRRKGNETRAAVVEQPDAEPSDSNLDPPTPADADLSSASVSSPAQPDSESEGPMASLLEEMLTSSLARAVPSCSASSGWELSSQKKRRGRPRKYPIPDADDPETAKLTEMLAAPIDRIEEMVDERIARYRDSHFVQSFDEDNVASLLDSVPEFLGPVGHVGGQNQPAADQTKSSDQENGAKGGECGLTKAEVLQQVLQSIALDLHSDRCSSSTNSVYETASDLGSTSTTASGCLSRKKWRRRKRNLTGWPRSKKRKPFNAFSDVSEGSNDGTSTSSSEAPYLSPCREMMDNASSSEPPTLTTIHEESSCKDSPSAASQTSEGVSPSRLSRDYGSSGGGGGGGGGAGGKQLSKPFQFQRKTLKFVGKRILRQKRHAPQRLEYWPRFPAAAAAENRKRRRRKS